MRLHTTVWDTGSRCSANSRCGMSASIPNGPFWRRDAGSQPERASTGATSVYAHIANPADIPAIAPVRLAPRHISPPTRAGATCITAAKETNPKIPRAARSRAIRP